MGSTNTLLRRYLCKRLAEYYSQPADKVVGTGPRCIDFGSLFNEWHWKHKYKSVYKQQQGMWLTPVELFHPYYSNVFANFVRKSMTTIDEKRHGDGVFEIVELGGGRGTNANALLNHLSECHSDMYERLHRYTIFDTSPTLHELQRRVLIEGSKHADKVVLRNIDMMDVAEGNSKFLTHSDTPTIVFALELLDNLPHDKIGRCIETGKMLQAEVVPVFSTDFDPADHVNAKGSELDTSQPHAETFSPINDPLLLHILSLSPSLYTPLSSRGPRWVPTVALGILMKLFECRPNSSVAFADFDWLPGPDVDSLSITQKDSEVILPAAEQSVGDPLVTDMKGNDHLCYLTSPPNALCDILFPTDFGRMAAFAKLIQEQEISAMKQCDFLMKYGSDEVNKTKGWTGYSPMINDFGNCSVLTITPSK
ncbi:hypothetical protein ACHAXR_011880 [Thalassiosira sp. AJA248-18]